MDCYVDSMVTHHEVLGVNFDASLVEIKRAYKSRLLCVHPDKNNDTKLAVNESVNKIQEAYRILGDEKLRREYESDVVKNQKKTGYMGTGDGLDEYSLDDFMFDPENLEYSMNCPRCTAERGFTLNENTLESYANNFQGHEQFEILMQCSCCSLWLKISFCLANEED